jgi:hypothetical protein
MGDGASVAPASCRRIATGRAKHLTARVSAPAVWPRPEPYCKRSQSIRSDRAPLSAAADGRPIAGAPVATQLPGLFPLAGPSIDRLNPLNWHVVVGRNGISLCLRPSSGACCGARETRPEHHDEHARHRKSQLEIEQNIAHEKSPYRLGDKRPSNPGGSYPIKEKSSVMRVTRCRFARLRLYTRSCTTSQLRCSSLRRPAPRKWPHC